MSPAFVCTDAIVWRTKRCKYINDLSHGVRTQNKVAKFNPGDGAISYVDLMEGASPLDPRALNIKKEKDPTPSPFFFWKIRIYGWWEISRD